MINWQHAMYKTQPITPRVAIGSYLDKGQKTDLCLHGCEKQMYREFVSLPKLYNALSLQKSLPRSSIGEFILWKAKKSSE